MFTANIGHDFDVRLEQEKQKGIFCFLDTLLFVPRLEYILFFSIVWIFFHP